MNILSSFWTKKWYFRKIDGISKNHEHWVGCNFWSRVATEMVETAMKRLDLEFFNCKFLGNIGVPYAFLQCHLWVRWVCFLLISVFNCKMYYLGTMGTTMVPKNIRVKKYDVWVFKRRIARMIWISGCVDTNCWKFDFFMYF